jgi:hypothetical protein
MALGEMRANGVCSLSVLCNLYRTKSAIACCCGRCAYSLLNNLRSSIWLQAFVLNGFRCCAARSISGPEAIERFLCFPNFLRGRPRTRKSTSSTVRLGCGETHWATTTRVRFIAAIKCLLIRIPAAFPRQLRWTSSCTCGLCRMPTIDVALLRDMTSSLTTSSPRF